MAIRADPPGFGPVVWTPAGAIQALPMLPGCDSARGLAINDRGDVVGACDTVSGPRAVLWEGGAVRDLGTLPGHGASEAGASVIIGTNGGPYTIPNGTHTITAHVDDVNRFAESDETNNRLSRPITLP